MSKPPGKIANAFGKGSVGALIGGVVGCCGGALLALFMAGLSALHWYRAQPPDWYIVTGFCAIVFVIVAVVAAAVIGALVCALLAGLASALVSGARLAGNK